MDAVAKGTRFQMDFRYYADTVNSYRYKESAAKDADVVGDLYVKKRVLGDNPPRWISVTITIEASDQL